MLSGTDVLAFFWLMMSAISRSSDMLGSCSEGSHARSEGRDTEARQRSRSSTEVSSALTDVGLQRLARRRRVRGHPTCTGARERAPGRQVVRAHRRRVVLGHSEIRARRPTSLELSTQSGVSTLSLRTSTF